MEDHLYSSLPGEIFTSHVHAQSRHSLLPQWFPTVTWLTIFLEPTLSTRMCWRKCITFCQGGCGYFLRFWVPRPHLIFLLIFLLLGEGLTGVWRVLIFPISQAQCCGLPLFSTSSLWVRHGLYAALTTQAEAAPSVLLLRMQCGRQQRKRQWHFQWGFTGLISLLLLNFVVIPVWGSSSDLWPQCQGGRFDSKSSGSHSCTLL